MDRRRGSGDEDPWWRGSAVWAWAGSGERVERERGEMIRVERELRELRERKVRVER